MKRFISGFFACLLLFVVLYSVLSIRPYRVSGDSMNPYLQREQIVVVDRISRHFYPLHRSEVVVYSDITDRSEKYKIKRLIGLPSDTIKISDAMAQNLCNSRGGQWSEKVRECLGVDKNVCESIGGQFNECASACRNNPEAQVCTLQCVQVCSIK